MINSFAQHQIDQFKEKFDSIQPLVVIRCVTYNHEAYIRQTLDGFVMQQTNFPFVAIVHDDASTDSTAEIIREYEGKYPKIIFPIFEKENQHSKGIGSIGKILSKAINESGAKYVAYCEGDDYWTDYLKLQKQVDFLEANPDYSMIATNCMYNREGDLSPNPWHTQFDYDASFKEVVLNGGLYLATTSLLLRHKYYQNIPTEVTSQYIGDYPLQIYFAYIGKVRILKDITCVYRVMAQGSWTSKIKENKNRKLVMKRIDNESRLLDDMDKVTEYKYHDIFLNQKDYFKLVNLAGFNKPLECLPIYIRSSKHLIKRIGLKNTIYRIIQLEIPWVYSIYKGIKNKLHTQI